MHSGVQTENDHSFKRCAGVTRGTYLYSVQPAHVHVAVGNHKHPQSWLRKSSQGPHQAQLQKQRQPAPRLHLLGQPRGWRTSACLQGPASCQLTGPQPLVDAVGRKPGVTPTRMVSPEQCRQVALAHCLAALCSHLRFPDYLPLDKPQMLPPLGGLPPSLWPGLALLTPVLMPFP